MPRSHWKLHLNASSEASANKITNSCVKEIDRPPVESSIEQYSKGGYTTNLEFFHRNDLSWSEVVLEVIEFGQRLGTGWRIGGDISEEYSAILSKNNGDRIGVPGLDWAHCQVFNDRKAS